MPNPVASGALYPQDETFATIGEIHDAALAALDPQLADFLEGGAGSETTLSANREAFSRWVIRPRPMRGVSSPDMRTSLLGVELDLPLLTAPFGGDGLFAPDGHLAVARANEACGVASIVPEAGTHSYEAIAEAAPRAARFAQVHPLDHLGRQLQRIRDAGYTAACVTIDCPTGGYRTRNLRNRFDPDLQWFAGNCEAGGTLGVAEVFGRLVGRDAPAWDWKRLQETLAVSDLPWIAKGVLTAEAAVEAVDAGAGAVIVSSHGGRQVDPAPASLDALPEVVGALQGRVPVLLDSGVRSGADVFIALALGADAVIVGRLAAYGLAADGEAGVRRAHELLADELRVLLILAGVQSVRQLNPGDLGRRPS